MSEKEKLFWIVGVVLVVVVLVFGALKITSHEAVSQNQSVTVFSGETLQQNALTARLHYFKDAFTVIAQNPFLGVGLRHYGEAVKLYKDTPAFYASSPHNESLQLFAELGIVGGLLFVLFAVLILVRLFRLARSGTQSSDWFTRAALLAGGVGVFVCMCMEVGWGYVANPLFFFILVGAVYGTFAQHTELHVNRFAWIRFFIIPLLVIAGLVGIAGIGYWYQSYHLEWGLIRSNEQRYPEALAELQQANRFGDFDSGPHYIAATIFEKEAQLAGTASEQKELLTSALAEIGAAIARKPEKPLFYSWQALIYKELGDENGYRQALEMTIRYNPIEGVYEYDQLATLYNHEKQYQKTINLATKVLSYYPLDLYANPYWVNPDKPTVWQEIADIYKQESIAYTKSGDMNSAKAAFVKAKEYDATILP